MNEEFNLSEKRKQIKKKIIDDWFSEKYKMNKDIQEVFNYIFNETEKQEKEFIKRLKEHYEIKGWEIIKIKRLINIIDKLAGDKLTEEDLKEKVE